MRYVFLALAVAGCSEPSSAVNPIKQMKSRNSDVREAMHTVVRTASKVECEFMSKAEVVAGGKGHGYALFPTQDGEHRVVYWVVSFGDDFIRMSESEQDAILMTAKATWKKHVRELRIGGWTAIKNGKWVNTGGI